MDEKLVWHHPYQRSVRGNLLPRMMNQTFVHVPSENQMKGALREFFLENGFKVDDIRAGKKERADFLISTDYERIILELKIKGEDEEELRDRRKILDSGSIYSRSESSLRRNRMSGLVRKGVSQLVETPDEADFKVLWLHAAGRYGEILETRLTATLYGRRQLIHTENEHDDRYCYYFDNSDFFRHRSVLNAAIVSFEDRCQLCINDLYPDADAFRRSEFRSLFGEGYIDPVEFERMGDAYIVDGSVDRRDEMAVTRFIIEKYQCGMVQSLDLAHHSVEIDLPRDRKAQGTDPKTSRDPK